MEHYLSLVDHTFEFMLKEHQSLIDMDKVYNILKKYSVQIFDISLETVRILENNLPPFFFRVEVEPNVHQINQLDFSKNKNFQGIIIRWKHGDTIFSLEKVLKEIALYKEVVYLKIMNTASLLLKEVVQYEELRKRYHIKGFIFGDLESCLDPFSTYDIMLSLNKVIQTKTEFCAGNQYGLATANSMAALQSGVHVIHSVVGGICLKEGAAMEEVIMGGKFFRFVGNNMDTRNLAIDCENILKTVHIKIPVDKAIIGKYIFAHESGIHVDGVIKNPLLYEAIIPEEVGLKRKIVIGKHSGKAAIKMKFEEMGIQLTVEEISYFTEKTKRLSIMQKSAITQNQLIDMYNMKNSNISF